MERRPSRNRERGANFRANSGGGQYLKPPSPASGKYAPVKPARELKTPPSDATGGRVRLPGNKIAGWLQSLRGCGPH